MTSIRSFSEILRDATGMTEAEKTRYASIIHSETIRLTRLLDDLLDLSVLENGQVTLNLRHGTLGDVLDHAITTTQASAPRPLEVERPTQGEDLVLYTDLDRLGQVFINLISNAQKYCRADAPRLRIRVEQRGQGHVVVFHDNGDGIDADAQALIFEKFSRLSTNMGDGAGLGLAICREIMERLQGDISFRADVAGTCFEVHLPKTLPDVPDNSARMAQV